MSKTIEFFLDVGSRPLTSPGATPGIGGHSHGAQISWKPHASWAAFFPGQRATARQPR